MVKSERMIIQMSEVSFVERIVALTRLTYNLFLIVVAGGCSSIIGGGAGAIVGASLMGFSLSAVIAEDWNRITYNYNPSSTKTRYPRSTPRRYKAPTRNFQSNRSIQRQARFVPEFAQAQPSIQQRTVQQQTRKNKNLRFIRKHVLPIILLRWKKKTPTDDRKLLEMQKYRKCIERNEIFFGRLSDRQRF